METFIVIILVVLVIAFISYFGYLIYLKLVKPQEFENKHTSPSLKQFGTEILRTNVTYVGGGNIDKQKNVGVIVTDKKLIYGLVHELDVSNIEGVSISNQEQVTTHIKSRLTVTRLATFGVFALAMPKHKVVNQKFDQTFLTIDYSENGLECTLVFKGPNVQKVMQAIKKAKQITESK